MSATWDAFATTATTADRYCLSWSSQGPAGSGKSHFLLTAPDPIWVGVFSDPGGISRLVKQHPEFRKKDIRWTEYAFNPAAYDLGDRPKAARDAYERFRSDYATALKHARTVGWDKEDQVWELLRYAKLDHYTDKPASYYELNLEYANWFHEAADAGVNLGVLRGMKEKWGQNAKGSPVSTGELVPRGQKEVDEKVMVVLDHRFDADAADFVTRIHDKCRVGPAKDLIGQEFPGLDFETLATLLYPEADPSVWA